MSKRHSELDIYTITIKKQRVKNVPDDVPNDGGEESGGESEGEKDEETECCHTDSDDSTQSVTQDEYEIADYFKSINESLFEHITISKSINTITDLIDLGKLYQPFKTYNIDMKTLHHLVDPLTDLQNMIGMETIKQEIVDHVLFRIQGLDERHQTMMHTVIEGPPGTGKTEVARIIGRIYLSMGILKNNKFIKATRSNLIAGYLGQTAILTQKIINSASGGVLFIDEVYALGNSEKRDSFSKECIDTLNENLTERKNDFICIIAGYKKDIQECFFSYNAGLERRFPIRFKMDEYTPPELFQIFQKKVKDGEWTLEDSVKVDFFEKNKKEFHFFGGDMEILFNSCKRAHSRRIFCTESTKKNITITDLERGYESFCNHRKKTEEESGVWKTMFL